MIFLDFVFSHERPTRGTFVEGPRESMIGVVAHNLAKCGEILCQVEFGIGLLVGIVVVATGATVLTTVVTSITATSIAIALLTLVPLEAGFLSAFFSASCSSSFWHLDCGGWISSAFD